MSDSDEPLVEWAGEDASLTQEEADAMFAVAFEPAPEAPRRHARRRTRGRWSIGILLAACALAAAAWFLTPSPPAERALYRGVKSPTQRAPMRLEMMAFSARPGSPPEIGRELRDGDVLAREDAIVFRYSVSAPAHLVLVTTRPSRELLWSSDAPVEQGEREIAHANQVLAMNPAPYGPRFELALVAVPVDARLPASADDALDGCPTCTRVTLSLSLEEEP